MITDVSKITAKKLPRLTIEYKQDTRSLLTSKEEKEKKASKNILCCQKWEKGRRV